MKKGELKVAALESGTVIDHIPSDRLFEAVSLLGLDRMKAPVTIGYNLPSSKMGSKGIIKVAGRFFTDEELNRLALVAPAVSLCVIRGYEVVEKKTVELPSELSDLVVCPNSKCISNNEPMKTRFKQVRDGVLKCCYCNREVNIGDIVLK